jgi:acyl-CoA thioester hydrolase
MPRPLASPEVRLPDPDRWTVVSPLRPRFRDTDAMGHINNAVYVTYLEVARQEYWRAFRGEDDYRAVPFILAHVDIDFRSEAHMDEALELCIRCSHVSARSFGFDYAIREAKSRRLVAEAHTVQVCYDYAKKAVVSCPDELRARLESFEGRALARKAPS